MLTCVIYIFCYHLLTLIYYNYEVISVVRYQARIGDLVNISCPHGAVGMIVTGSPDKYDDGAHCARLTDVVVCLTCGQTGHIVTGSSNTYVNGLQSAKVGDMCVGTCNPGKKCCPHSRTGIIATGSPKTYTNEITGNPLRDIWDKIFAGINELD